jgi:hypothetical protein
MSDEPASPGGSAPDGPRGGEAGVPGPAAEPGRLLTDLAGLRHHARAARHAYWFPLLLFGVLTCAAAPLYVIGGPTGSGAYPVAAVPLVLGGALISGNGFLLGWYWAIALTGGYLVTLLWYRRHARRAGVATPARGYLITGIALTVIAAVLPPLSAVPAFRFLAVAWLLPADLWIRGTLAFLIIAAGLWVLARAERSRVLAVIALVYTGAALLASLYNVENILFRLGWNPGNSNLDWRLTALPGILLPAAVLLAGGLAALLVQRRRERA